MKTALSICAAILLTGCNTTSFHAEKMDGTKITITNQRLLWASEDYSATLTTNGASLSAKKSNVDKDAVGAIVEGAVTGAMKSKP